MNHVCAIECKSPSYYAFTYVTNTGRTVNSIYQSSVAYCVADDFYTMYHRYGYIDIKSANLSYNEAKTSCSALSCYPSSTNENEIGIASISYSSFANNGVNN